MKYVFSALAATTLAANAAVIFDTTPRDDQANFDADGTVAGGSGQTWITGILGSENLLSSIRVDNRAAGAAGTGLYLAVYENDASDGQTWTPGALVGVSTNTQDMDSDGGFATWTFSSEALADSSRYLFTFTSDAGGTTTVGSATGVTLNEGNSEQSAFTNGGVAFGGSHAMAAQITTTDVVPEPSSAALLGLGGLALVMRRRK